MESHVTTTEQETTVSIQQTVEQTLTRTGYGSYMRQAGPVVEALVARETGLAEKLIDYAVDAGAEEDEIRAYLTEIGMSVPAQPVEEDDDEEDEEDNSDILRGLRRIEDRIDSLTEFARANGYRG